MPLAYIDYAGKNGNGVKVDYIGVGPGVRYYTSPPARARSRRTWVRASARTSSMPRAAATRSTRRASASRSTPALEFNQSYLLEVNYTNAGSVSGTRLDGINIQAGVRF